MRKLRFNELSPAQARAAKRFAEKHPEMSVSQAAKYLQYIFAYCNGELTAEQFKEKTGWTVSPDWN